MAMAAEPPPSGHVTISSKAVALGVGVSWGDGNLKFGGKDYKFSVDERDRTTVDGLGCHVADAEAPRAAREAAVGDEGAIRA